MILLVKGEPLRGKGLNLKHIINKNQHLPSIRHTRLLISKHVDAKTSQDKISSPTGSNFLKRQSRYSNYIISCISLEVVKESV